jgi:hypothetical protein
VSAASDLPNVNAAGDDPLVSTAEAAEIIEGDERGVRFLMRRGALIPEPQAWGTKRMKLFFRRSAVEAARPYYQRLRDFQNQGCHKPEGRPKEYTLKEASEARGISMHLLRQATREGDEERPDGRPRTAATPGFRLEFSLLDPPPTGAIPWKIVREPDLLRFECCVEAALRETAKLNRGRWKTLSEIFEALGVDDQTDRREMSACAKCWRRIGKLQAREMLVADKMKVPGEWREKENGGRVFDDLRQVRRLRSLTFFDFPQFQKLWDTDFTAVGVQKFKRLMSEHNGRCPVGVAGAALEKLGIVGKKRRGAVAKASGVEVVPERGEGARGRAVYVPRKRTRHDPAKILRSVFTGGRVNAGKGRREARALGLADNEIYAALKELGVSIRPMRPGERHDWVLPEEAAPRRRGGRGPGKKTARRHAAIIDCWERDRSQSNRAIARELGIDEKTVRAVLNAHRGAEKKSPC